MQDEPSGASPKTKRTKRSQSKDLHDPAPSWSPPQSCGYPPWSGQTSCPSSTPLAGGSWWRGVSLAENDREHMVTLTEVTWAGRLASTAHITRLQLAGQIRWQWEVWEFEQEQIHWQWEVWEFEQEQIPWQWEVWEFEQEQIPWQWEVWEFEQEQIRWQWEVWEFVQEQIRWQWEVWEFEQEDTLTVRGVGIWTRRYPDSERCGNLYKKIPWQWEVWEFEQEQIPWQWEVWEFVQEQIRWQWEVWEFVQEQIC